MMKRTFTLVTALILFFLCSSCRNKTGFEFSVTAIERARQWQPKSGGFMGITLTKGVSMKMTEGSLSRFQAQPGFEIVVVRLNVKKLIDNAELSLKTAQAEDKSGQKYSNLAGALGTLGHYANEERELAFAVPNGTELKNIHLTEEVSIELE